MCYQRLQGTASISRVVPAGKHTELYILQLHVARLLATHICRQEAGTWHAVSKPSIWA